MKAAVFLDRDGTINEEVGYINHIDRFRIYPWAATAVRKLNQAGIAVVVVTNQSGIARGYFPESLVQDIHTRLAEELGRAEARLDAVYYCPHHPEGKIDRYRKVCDCRKPSPGMLERAGREHAIDLKRSFIVSDRYQDVLMGMNAGASGILVLTGYGKGEVLYQRDSWPRQPDRVASDLLEAVDWILDGAGAGRRQSG